MREKYKSKIGKHNFCSKDCYLSFHTKDTPKCICQNCGKVFKGDKYNANKYCSRECYNKHLSKNKNKSFSEENLKQLCNEYSTITEIAEKLNTSRPTVRKYLEKFDLLNTLKDKYDFHAKKIGQYDSN